MTEYFIPGVGYVRGAYRNADGIQRPANWLALATAEELDAEGAVAKPTPAADEVVEEGPDGWMVRNKTTDELATDLEAAKMAAAALVDAGCGNGRSTVITNIPGQIGTYVRKAEQADAYALDPGGTYPYLEQEAAGRGETVAVVAARIRATRDAWETLDAKLEGVRQGAKTAIAAAPDRTTVDAWVAWAATAYAVILAGGAAPAKPV